MVEKSLNSNIIQQENFLVLLEGINFMAIEHFEQPEILHIDDFLRLRKPLSEEYEKALPWYEDPEIMLMSEGIRDRRYNLEDINRMYNFLSDLGELYFIEWKEKGKWKPIGDITLAKSNIPIVIGDRSLWGKGIGKKVLLRVIGRSLELGLDYLRVPEVYNYNERSKGLFMSAGFKVFAKDDRVTSFIMEF